LKAGYWEFLWVEQWDVWKDDLWADMWVVKKVD
jgi:hypothetical protein